MAKRLKLLVLVFLVFLTVQPTVATGNPVIEAAFDFVGQNCGTLNRNQACYGHAQLVAEARPGYGSFVFDNSGDIEDLVKIQSLRLSGLDEAAETWGIVMLRLRANLPETSPQNVTLLAFGDVAMENAVQPPMSIDLTSSNYVNVRRNPSVQAPVVASIAPGAEVSALERLADNSWLRVNLPETDTTGWVSSEVMGFDSEMDSLNVAEASSSYYDQPMQAFFFESGEDDPDLNTVPPNGLLIQTPEGVGEVNLLINEVNIQLGSTVFFQAEPGGDMNISTIEGHADVRVDNIEFTAFPGTTVTVPLDENLHVSGPPRPPRPFDASTLANLPLGLLQRPAEVGAPLAQAEINSLMDQAALVYQEGPGSTGACPVPDCDDPGVDDPCPGESCDAPGHGGSCPGNSCLVPVPGAASNANAAASNGAASSSAANECHGSSCDAPGHNR